jgi:hypothetical protein
MHHEDSSMSTRSQPPTQADLCAGVALVAREWDPDAAAERLTLTVPSRSDPTTRHTLTGHSHGRDAACDCPGFAYRRRCSHVAAWPVLVEELERRFYADPAYTTAGLLSLAEFYAAIPDLNTHRPLAGRNNQQRAVIFAFLTDLPMPAKLIAVILDGRATQGSKRDHHHLIAGAALIFLKHLL